MKKRLIKGIILFFCLFLITACSANIELKNNKKDKNVPYTVYEYKDSDGCVYIVVHTREYDNYKGDNNGVGITQKVNQPKSCINDNK